MRLGQKPHRICTKKKRLYDSLSRTHTPRLISTFSTYENNSRFHLQTHTHTQHYRNDSSVSSPRTSTLFSFRSFSFFFNECKKKVIRWRAKKRRQRRESIQFSILCSTHRVHLNRRILIGPFNNFTESKHTWPYRVREAIVRCAHTQTTSFT